MEVDTILSFANRLCELTGGRTRYEERQAMCEKGRDTKQKEGNGNGVVHIVVDMRNEQDGGRWTTRGSGFLEKRKKHWQTRLEGKREETALGQQSGIGEEEKKK